MSIYICGGCNTGKAEIARKVQAEYPSFELILDPSETVFVPIFGSGLNSIFRKKLWRGNTTNAFCGLQRYLSILEQGNIITNEGPLIFLSHALFFGMFADFSDEQRREILERALVLLRKGLHFIVQKWTCDTNFAIISIALQKEFRNGRENIYTIPSSLNYNTTVETSVTYILNRLQGGEING